MNVGVGDLGGAQRFSLREPKDLRPLYENNNDEGRH